MGKVTVDQRMQKVLTALAAAILQVPCFKEDIPASWTDFVIAQLRKRGVSDSLIPPLLDVAWDKGYYFTPTAQSTMLRRKSGEFSSPRAKDVVNPISQDQIGKNYYHNPSYDFRWHPTLPNKDGGYSAMKLLRETLQRDSDGDIGEAP